MSLDQNSKSENYLLWLIQVGVLRKEVDRQGITDSFRLTPMGHQLVKKYTLNWKLASTFN
ncbi:Npun_F0494 family protein [Trichodesmium erythraeum]|uniref:Npun_F0494 family protein n=1 Tax=Trichodesmium erythraeum TaxID=1206 RepID=UPI00351B5908